MQVIGTDNTAGQAETTHTHTVSADTPSFQNPEPPVTPSIDIENSVAVGTTTIPQGFEYGTEFQANQGKLAVATTDDAITVTVTGGVESLDVWTDSEQSALGDKPWIALDIDTGLDDITLLTLDGVALTEDDVATATAWGLGAGHFILWLAADVVEATPASFTLAGEDITSVTFTVSVEDAE